MTSEGERPGAAPGPRARLRRVEGIAWRVIEGEAVLVNVRRDEVLHLNPTASFLWSGLDGGKTLAVIAAEMAGEFEVTEEEALADILEFAGLLLQQGVAELVDLGE
ncbi:MAG: PqqD family protein [Actinobacteria bacterium]|nr:PqqD family protein [Actinomycetota bacterium]